MLEAIGTLQPYIDDLINKNSVRFNNPTVELALIEKLYNIITQRRYIRFNGGCGSCIKEALLIINNWRKRELKKTELVEPIAEVPTTDQVDEPVIGSVEYNAKYVNEVNPFNPIGSDDEPVEKPKPRAKNAKSSTTTKTKTTPRNGTKRK